MAINEELYTFVRDALGRGMRRTDAAGVPHGFLRRHDGSITLVDVQGVGVRLTTLTPEQAKYLGVKVEGPYKAEHYRY